MKLVDLFCGIGGASYGGSLFADVALAVDSDPDALEVHRQNHPDCKHVCTALPCDSLTLPKGPIHIHASPPCQAVSQANRSVAESKRQAALHLIQWAARFCQEHGTTWSLEQVGSPPVYDLLNRMGVAFDVFDFSDLGVPQTRRRVIAGSPEIVEALRAEAGKDSSPLGVRDVIPRCRGSHVRNSTTSTFEVRDGARRQIPLTESHPSFARHVSEPAYTVTGNSPLRWYSPGAVGCTIFTPREVAFVQGFPANYKLHEVRRLAYLHVGNAIPPIVMSLIMREAVQTVRQRV